MSATSTIAAAFAAPTLATALAAAAVTATGGAAAAAASAGTAGLQIPLLEQLRLLGLEWCLQRWRAGVRRRVLAVRSRHGLLGLWSATRRLPPSRAAPEATALSAATTAYPRGGHHIGLHEHVRSPMEWRVRRRRAGRRVLALHHRDRLHRLWAEACTSSLPSSTSPFAAAPFAAAAASP